MTPKFTPDQLLKCNADLVGDADIPAGTVIGCPSDTFEQCGMLFYSFKGSEACERYGVEGRLCIPEQNLTVVEEG